MFCRILQRRHLHEKSLSEKTRSGGNVLRACRGGQRVQLSHLWQQVRPGTAHGQHPVRPYYGVGVAFVASLLRNLLGLGSLMAFPGSMFGALLCGLTYHKAKQLLPTLVAEVFGTSILGGLCAYPVAILLMGKSAGDIAFYAYIIPFLVSTAGGAVIAGVLLFSLQRSGALRSMQASLT